MYNPIQLENEFEHFEHGKSRMSAMRSAIRKADEHNDLKYQIGFRLDLCYESQFYDDSFDSLIVFPEVLALIDKQPDIILDQSIYFTRVNGTDRVLMVYKWIVGSCEDFYQIPYDDCMKYFDDFKKRSIAFGYNLKPYYKNMYYFYRNVDEELAKKYFFKFRELPSDHNGDCAACDRNFEIKFYLDNDDIETADRLSKDIENFSLTCGEENNAWLRMKKNYMDHYTDIYDFETAEKYIDIIERHKGNNKLSEFELSCDYLLCYTYTDIGKALKIYKKCWKEALLENCPICSFGNDATAYAFFKELGKVRKGSTIKLKLDKTFPLYSESETYKISEMEQFYYNRAKDTAQKFDARNRSDSFMKTLEYYTNCSENIEKRKGK